MTHLKQKKRPTSCIDGNPAPNELRPKWNYSGIQLIFWWLLPPENEVWRKMIFLLVSVILSTEGVASRHASQVTWLGGLHLGGLHPGGGVRIQRRGSASSRGGSASRGRGLHPGVCIQGGGQIPLQALQDTDNKWAVRILLECILVFIM